MPYKEHIQHRKAVSLVAISLLFTRVSSQFDLSQNTREVQKHTVHTGFTSPVPRNENTGWTLCILTYPKGQPQLNTADVKNLH